MPEPRSGSESGSVKSPRLARSPAIPVNLFSGHACHCGMLFSVRVAGVFRVAGGRASSEPPELRTTGGSQARPSNSPLTTEKYHEPSQTCATGSASAELRIVFKITSRCSPQRHGDSEFDRRVFLCVSEPLWLNSSEDFGKLFSTRSQRGLRPQPNRGSRKGAKTQRSDLKSLRLCVRFETCAHDSMKDSKRFCSGRTRWPRKSTKNHKKLFVHFCAFSWPTHANVES